MSSPMQIAVLVLLDVALWSIFYTAKVLSQEKRNQRLGEEARVNLYQEKERTTLDLESRV